MLEMVRRKWLLVVKNGRVSIPLDAQLDLFN
jgi:hypothetical protein